MLASRRKCTLMLAAWGIFLGLLSVALASEEFATTSTLFTKRIVVTDQAMGARCAVAADFDGDGKLDLVSASSNDNAVSWFRNQGVDPDTSELTFAIKQKITWSSLGSRIVTTGDVDSDGDVDVIGASYYDNTVRWFENDGAGVFTPRVVSTTVNEGQGVTVADLDNDGDLDIVTASSGDNIIAVFRNIDRGVFCDLKEVVDDNAVGVRTVIAADLNGDGMLDLAAASKDDDTVSWYPNDGKGYYPSKRVISAGAESTGAYSLVAVDIDKDGDTDLVVASNGNDHVSLWRNDGTGTFTKTLIFGFADFVLSVTAVDFDRDGDIDVASASFFDGYVRWYENLDGVGTRWRNHTIYVGNQGHYVATADMDGDGDEDLIAVTHAENAVMVFRAATSCDAPRNPTAACCAEGTEWSGAACVACAAGTYGQGRGADAKCVACPGSACWMAGLGRLPASCSRGTGCTDPAASILLCACAVDFVKDPATDTCRACPAGQTRAAAGQRTLATLGNYSAWEEQQGVCIVVRKNDRRPLLYGVIGGSVLVAILVAAAVGLVVHRRRLAAQADSLWSIQAAELAFDDPVQILGTGTFGVVMQGTYRGTAVAVKRVFPCGPLGALGGHSSLAATHSNWSASKSTLLGMGPAGLAGFGAPRGSFSLREAPTDPPSPRQQASSGSVSRTGRPSAGQQGKQSTGSAAASVSLVLPSEAAAAPANGSTRAQAQGQGQAGWKGREGRLSFPPPAAADRHWQPSFVAPRYGAANASVRDTGKAGLWRQSGGDASTLGLDASEHGSSQNLNLGAGLGGAGSMNECGAMQGGGLSNAVRKQLRQDFIGEMRLLAKLRHPCVITIMGAVISEDPLLVMECMGNGSLRDLLSNPSFALDPELTLPMLRDILQGTRFLHAASTPILHGDLKCANILVDHNFRAKVSDFGLSQKRKSGFVGTPFWMAPELLAGGFMTKESDVYSFGVTLWELMTRKVPYADAEQPDEEILELVKQGALRPECGEELDAELRECIEECWAQEAARRPTLEELEMKLIPLCGQNFYTAMEKRQQFASKQARLLQDVFPAHIANALLAGQKVEPEDHECVTIYFSDIVGFTTISAALSAQEVSQMLDRLYTAFDTLAEEHGVFKLETIGDAWVGVCNLTSHQPDHAACIARFSIAALNAAQSTSIHPDKPEMGCVQIRVGFHSGPVVSNVVGTRNPRYCLFGDTVNTASRMESNSEALRIHLSYAAARLVQRQDPSLQLIARGRIPIKGKGHMRTFWLHSGTHAPVGEVIGRIQSACSDHEEGAEPPESFARRPTHATHAQAGRLASGAA